jgi:hypothetical protein|tara:strand:+ start:822 stop:989 length:168 start_codon:yes stop_codon:yes gene_type:complete
MYIQFFPIYGFTVGFNYWNSNLDEFEGEDEETETEHLFQIILGIVGMSIHIWRSK